MSDLELLREYAEHHSERAFTELVSRHLNLVHSTALRVVGEAHLAQDVAQMVFLDLARKAGSLPRGTALPGWLYRSAWLSAASVLRAARRREERERKALEMAAIDASGASVWETLAPCLDEAMSQLDSGDQDALVLRFFDGCGLREVGQTLGLSEDAAQKRVSRALERLRGILARRGVKVSAGVLAPTLAANAVQAAPAGLASIIVGAAFAKAAAPAGLGFLFDKAMRLTTPRAAALTALVGLLPIGFEGHHLRDLRAEQTRLSERLAQARQTLSGLQSQDAVLAQRIGRNDDAIRQLEARAVIAAAPAPTPAAGALPAYVGVPKELVTQSKKTWWLMRDWQLSPLLVQVLGMRPEEVAAVNQTLSRLVSDVQTMQEARVTPSAERTLGADWWRTELQTREFRSFNLTACTNELQILRSNLFGNLEQAFGAQRTQVLMNGVEYSLRDQAVLLGGKAGLLTFVRPATPSDPVIANDRSSTMLIEARALATLPASIRQVVESWWDLTDLDHR